MKKKEYKRNRKRVQRVFDEWIYKLGLKWWRIDIAYCDSEQDFIASNGDTVVARTWARWQYLEAAISINVPAAARMDDDELEYAIVHELCHVLINEMREDNIKHEERTVTALAKAFIWVRDLSGEKR